MLTKQNDQLRRNLNEVEAEMIELQNALKLKDNTIHKKDREIEEVQRECAQLIGEMQKAEGRENAMNLASKQNTHLLRLLEQEEAKRETLTDDRDSLGMQLGVVRKAHENLTKEVGFCICVVALLCFAFFVGGASAAIAKRRKFHCCSFACLATKTTNTYKERKKKLDYKILRVFRPPRLRPSSKRR